MRFEGLPIGVIDSQLEGEDFFLGGADGLPAPGCEYPLGAVQNVLFPGNGNELDAAAGLAELLPKIAVRPSPGVELAGGSHARVDVGKNCPVLLDGHGHLDVEIPDAAIGPPVVDSFRE